MTIKPATLRDVCFIAANMRDQDRQEVMATALVQSMTQAGAMSFYSSQDWCWTAWLDDQPVGAFGISYGNPFQPHIRQAWAFGTKRFKRSVPEITRFIRANWFDALIAEGVTRVECRSMLGHDIAHRWLTALGAHPECEMRNYGTGGQTFIQWVWIKEDFEHVL